MTATDPWERLVDVLVRSEHSKADEQGVMLLTPVGVAVTLRDQVDLLADLAFAAGRRWAKTGDDWAHEPHPDLAQEECDLCGHPNTAHTDWWDSTENGGGCGFACRMCSCPSYEPPDDPRHHSPREPEQIPLPVAWRMLASGDPGAVFDGVFLLLHPDGSVTWTQHPEDADDA